MSMPQTRSNTRVVNSMTPGPADIDEEEAKSGDITRNNGMPTMPTSNSLGIQMPQHQVINNMQMSADQRNFFERQTDTEKGKPKLENAIVPLWKIFRTDYLINKEENNGIQSMVDLISVKARQGLVISLKMNTHQFLKLTDDV